MISFVHAFCVGEQTRILRILLKRYIFSRSVNFSRAMSNGLDSAARLYSLLLLRFRLGVVALLFLGVGGWLVVSQLRDSTRLGARVLLRCIVPKMNPE